MTKVTVRNVILFKIYIKVLQLQTCHPKLKLIFPFSLESFRKQLRIALPLFTCYIIFRKKNIAILWNGSFNKHLNL